MKWPIVTKRQVDDNDGVATRQSSERTRPVPTPELEDSFFNGEVSTVAGGTANFVLERSKIITL